MITKKKVKIEHSRIKRIYKWLILPLIWLFLSIILWTFGMLLAFYIIDNGIHIPNFLYEYDGFNDKQISDLIAWLLCLVSMLFAGCLIYLFVKWRNNKNF